MLLPPFAPFETLRAVRFYAGLSQSEMAGLLGMTQGWLSKFEAGIGEFTVGHLLRLRSHLGISSDAFIDGRIPYLQLSEKSARPLRIPRRYTENAATRVRILYGFLHAYEKHLGREAVEARLSELKIHSEILAEPNFPVHVSLLGDLVDFGFEAGVLGQAAVWQEIAAYNLSPVALDPGAFSFAGPFSPLEFYERFLEVATFYSRDLNYVLKRSGKNAVEISIQPSQEFRQALSLSGSHFVKFISPYSGAILKRTATRFLDTPVKVQKSPRSRKHDSADQVYQVSW